MIHKLEEFFMAFVYKHWEITPDQVKRIEADPDSAVSPADMAILSYLTLPDEKRKYALGRFTMGRFDTEVDNRHADSLHTGSVTGDDYQVVARGRVVEDQAAPDGIYETYVPI
jgi:hypothetical protein